MDNTPTTVDPRLKAVQTILDDALVCGEPELTDTMARLGIDSLDITEIVVGLEEEFDIEIEDKDAAKILADASTVADILTYLNDRLGPALPTNGQLMLTEDQFIDRYKPETDKDGNLYVQREWKTDRGLLEAAVETNRCWTAQDDDNGNFCISEGNHIVNRLYNIITRVPREDPDWIVSVDCGTDDRDEEEDDEE